MILVQSDKIDEYFCEIQDFLLFAWVEKLLFGSQVVLRKKKTENVNSRSVQKKNQKKMNDTELSTTRGCTTKDIDATFCLVPNDDSHLNSRSEAGIRILQFRRGIRMVIGNDNRDSAMLQNNLRIPYS
jgi:prenyltransferase beta subunit